MIPPRYLCPARGYNSAATIWAWREAVDWPTTSYLPDKSTVLLFRIHEKWRSQLVIRVAWSTQRLPRIQPCLMGSVVNVKQAFGYASYVWPQVVIIVNRLHESRLSNRSLDILEVTARKILSIASVHIIRLPKFEQIKPQAQDREQPHFSIRKRKMTNRHVMSCITYTV